MHLLEASTLKEAFDLAPRQKMATTALKLMADASAQGEQPMDSVWSSMSRHTSPTPCNAISKQAFVDDKT